MIKDLPIDLKRCQQKLYDGKPGNYLCRCMYCTLHFYGDKRDFCCPKCETKPAEVTPPSSKIDWAFINKHRVRDGKYATTEADGCNGAFEIRLCGEPLRIIASDGGNWKHVSVSRPLNSHKVPTWEMMCKVKELFYEPEDSVVQFHPAKSQYVNMGEVLHLWMSTDPEKPMPTPPCIMVGIK